MRKGFVQVDWVIGVSIFIIFSALTIIYYTNLTAIEQVHPLQDSASMFADTIMDYLQVDAYSVPVKYDAAAPASDVVFYLDLIWPVGQNTTSVLKDGTSQECYITGERLYWKSDVTSGKNNFTVRFRDLEQSLQCTDTLALGGAVQTFPGAMEKSLMLSQTRIDEMNATNYSLFKNSLNIDRQFRVEMDINGTEFNYGPVTPLTDIFAREKWGTILETDERVSMRILVW